MKAIFYERFGEKPFINEVPEPIPSSAGVVVKILASGICRSDWHGWQGHDEDIILPHVPGHELVGEIVEVGKEVKSFRNGQRITVPFVSGCGHCALCESGNHQICDFQFQPGFTAWGSFAQYAALEYADTNLVELPPSLDSVDAASLGCRFVTAFRAIVDQASVKSGDTVAIHGCGGVGLSAIMLASALGAEVIAVDINKEALALAELCGAHHCINARQKEVVGTIQSITSGGVDVSVDALGSKETCFNSICCLKKMGKHLQIGLMAGKDHMPELPMHLVIAKELKIIGSHGMQAFRYRELFKMIEEELINPGILVRSRVNLEQAIEQLVQMENSTETGISVVTDFE